MTVARAGRGRGGLSANERLWTVSEVAEYLQFRPSTVRAYAERGVLPCVRLGNRLRFKPSDISEWVEQRHTKGGR